MIYMATQENQVVFKAKAVIMSNGAKQHLHPLFYKEWFPFMKKRKDRVMLSDKFLRKEVYKSTM